MDQWSSIFGFLLQSSVKSRNQNQPKSPSDPINTGFKYRDKIKIIMKPNMKYNFRAVLRSLYYTYIGTQRKI